MLVLVLVLVLVLGLETKAAVEGPFSVFWYLQWLGLTRASDTSSPLLS